jgi:muramidase (phage lysozyme)
MTASELNTLVDAASELIGEGNWSSALTKLTQAWAGLVGMPDTKHGEAELRWDRAGIKALMEECRRNLGASRRSGNNGGFRSIGFGGVD